MIRILIESPVDAVDSNGAPYRDWVPKRNPWAAVEGDQMTASESQQAPYEQNTRSFTLRIRGGMAPGLNVTVRDRVRTQQWVGEITAVRYNAKRDLIFIDVVTGGTEG